MFKCSGQFAPCFNPLFTESLGRKQRWQTSPPKSSDSHGVPVMGQWLMNLTSSIMRTQVRFLALLSGLRIQRCCELWCRLQTGRGSGVAVAVVPASSCNSNSTPSPETCIGCRCGPKKEKKKLCRVVFSWVLVHYGSKISSIQTA